MRKLSSLYIKQRDFQNALNTLTILHQKQEQCLSPDDPELTRTIKVVQSITKKIQKINAITNQYSDSDGESVYSSYDSMGYYEDEHIPYTCNCRTSTSSHTEISDNEV